jgi:hypothetical protein
MVVRSVQQSITRASLAVFTHLSILSRADPQQPLSRSRLRARTAARSLLPSSIASIGAHLFDLAKCVRVQHNHISVASTCVPQTFLLS